MLSGSQTPHDLVPRQWVPGGAIQQPETQKPAEKTVLISNVEDLTTSQEKLCQQTRKPRRFESLRQNWKLSITYWAILCTITLTINVSLTIAVSATSGFESGLGTLMTGGCGSVKNLNIGVHVLINALSTALLAGSNFCMQCLSAPTRREVDRAHARGVALDIGVPSLRNLRYVGFRRFTVWFLFAISSVPLHLLYNSVVYSSLSHHNYYIVLGNDQFFDAPNLPDRINLTHIDQDIGEAPPRRSDPFDTTSPCHGLGSSEEGVDCLASRLSLRSRKLSIFRDKFREGQLQRLSVNDCIRVYAQDFLTDYGFTPGLEAIEQCQSEIPRLLSDPQINFKPWGETIDHCFAEPMDSECSLMFNLQIAVIVIAINAMKIVLMVLAAKCLDAFPLLTIGDALQSFITVPDMWTKGKCLYQASQFKARSDPWSPPAPLLWQNVRHRWFRAPGRKRWIQFILTWLLAFASLCGLTVHGFILLRSVFPNPTDALRFGIGNIKSSTILYIDLPTYGPQAVLYNILVANTPQLILSVVYFAFNLIATSMTTGLEWANLALYRKGLRVSKNPTGEQRHTYFLQLPYRYGIPLLLLSGVMHWLVSQGIFLVATTEQVLELSGEITRDGPHRGEYVGEKTYYNSGWSPLACVLAIVVSAAMCLALLGLSLRRYPTDMPLGGNNSLVLAAACHVGAREQQEGVADRKLQWGVVDNFDGQVHDVGHCALSSQYVSYPMVGMAYS